MICDQCNGLGGWHDMDSRWVECIACDGTGEVEEQQDDDSDEDDC